MKKFVFIFLTFLALFSSCKKDNVVPDVKIAALSRDTLYYVMKDWYYWYNKPEATNVTDLTKDHYSDPYKLLEAMRYIDLDRWSFILTKEEYIAQTTGTFVGHGFRIGVDNSGKARIAMIYNKSPLYTNGVRRGWIVKTINNVDPAPLITAKNNDAYTALIKDAKEGITNDFVFINPLTGTQVPVTSAKKKFDINTVLLYDTLHLSSGVTGHLVFESFFNPAPTELAEAFAYFKANNITNLILDLRYNSGGEFPIAQTLASYIAGNARQGVVFAKLSYNDKRQAANSTFAFKTTASSLGLPKIVVITTRSTASASEDVMNGLDPVVPFVTIGDTTNGKPTGMNLFPIADKYFVFPVTFSVVNKDNVSVPYSGIIPDKLVTDDITRDFNDRQELCLKEAINYLQNGTFTTKSIQRFQRSPQFSEKPEWMNNTFVLKR